jgi:hypothetical protein
VSSPPNHGGKGKKAQGKNPTTSPGSFAARLREFAEQGSQVCAWFRGAESAAVGAPEGALIDPSHYLQLVRIPHANGSQDSYRMRYNASGKPYYIRELKSSLKSSASFIHHWLQAQTPGSNSFIGEDILKGDVLPWPSDDRLPAPISTNSSRAFDGGGNQPSRPWIQPMSSAFIAAPVPSGAALIPALTPVAPRSSSVAAPFHELSPLQQQQRFQALSALEQAAVVQAGLKSFLELETQHQSDGGTGSGLGRPGF